MEIKTIFCLVLLLLPLQAQSLVKIAVIDSGYDFESTWDDAESYGLKKPKICSSGHKDFTRTGLNDNYGHGTHIIGLIAKNITIEDYCIIVIKFTDPNFYGGTTYTTTEAFKYATRRGVDIINYSGGGDNYSATEKWAVLDALAARIKVVAAAGNNGRNLAETPFYPASYSPEIEVVGHNGAGSNYGANVQIEQGHLVMSLFTNNSYRRFTGTSQATAIRTGKIVNEIYEVKKLNSSFYTHLTESLNNLLLFFGI